MAASLAIHLPAQAEIFHFEAVLNGANETGLGDLNSRGVATLTIVSQSNTINWSIAVNNIAGPTDAYIRSGAAGVNGPVLVHLGWLTGSGLIDTDLAAVLANPSNFYINLQMLNFPMELYAGRSRLYSNLLRWV